jgi:hypothetical protein
MVRRLLPQRRVELSSARGHGDSGGIVLLSFTFPGHHGHRPFRRQAGA